AAVATREGVRASPALAAWVRDTLEPLLLAGREGYAPSTFERRRLALLGAISALVTGWFVAGAAVALPLALAGPAGGTVTVGRPRARYRAAVEGALPDVAVAIADSLTAGRSLRASICAADASLDGSAAVELARLRAELELGAPTPDAIGAWRRRMRSDRV